MPPTIANKTDKTTEDLDTLSNLAKIHNKLKNVTSSIFSITQGEQLYSCKLNAQERERKNKREGEG